MAVPTTLAALTAYIEKNPHLDQVTLSDLAQGLAQHFRAHDRLRRSAAAALGMSRREQQWPQLVARHYAASLCGCPALAQVLLTGGFIAYAEEAEFF